ncbi:MAG: DUF502 domain-containing protein [Candidatus Thioglobus sp.]|nr:DUF502 domain-containing protein [Candidatus Thioglobus sp.]
MKRLRNYFISGLLFWIPLGLSVLVIKFFVNLLDSIIPSQYQSKILLGLDIDLPGTGMVLVIIITLITGVLVSNFIGQKLLRLWEKTLNKIPGFRNIYSSIKQLSSTLLNSSNDSFKKAVLVEYPRSGMWTIAFQTGNYHGEVEEIIGEEIINIYVPTTPNPTSGFFIMMPKKDVIELEMSVDSAFKLIISTGVVAPD